MTLLTNPQIIEHINNEAYNEIQKNFEENFFNADLFAAYYVGLYNYLSYENKVKLSVNLRTFLYDYFYNQNLTEMNDWFVFFIFNRFNKIGKNNITIKPNGIKKDNKIVSEIYSIINLIIDNSNEYTDTILFHNILSIEDFMTTLNEKNLIKVLSNNDYFFNNIKTKTLINHTKELNYIEAGKFVINNKMLNEDFLHYFISESLNNNSTFLYSILPNILENYSIPTRFIENIFLKSNNTDLLIYILENFSLPLEILSYAIKKVNNKKVVIACLENHLLANFMIEYILATYNDQDIVEIIFKTHFLNTRHRSILRELYGTKQATHLFEKFSNKTNNNDNIKNF